MTVLQVWTWLEAVPDPEIPVLSVVDLGVVRGVRVIADCVEVEVAPTYSGCPATEIIEKSIVDCLIENGVGDVSLKRVLSPPWTTAWITSEGREKLLAYGIAPPTDGGRQTRVNRRCPANSVSTMRRAGDNSGQRIWIHALQGLI